MTSARSTFLALLCLSVAPAAFAQTSYADPTVGAFDRLPAGEQKIARSLFESQTVSATGPAPMSLDQIAAAKGSESGSGWGNVFKQMQADGLVQARNLGQVVSGHYSPAASDGTVAAQAAAVGPGKSATSSAGSTGARDKVVVTTASGRTAAHSQIKGGEKNGAAGGQGVTTAGTSSGSGNGVQSAAGNGGAGKITTASGKGSQAAGSSISTASGGGAGGGKALGHGK